MTNHGCGVCLETIAVSEYNDTKAYMVKVIRGNKWTEQGVLCSCGATNPFDAPAVYTGMIANPSIEIDSIERNEAVTNSLKPKNGK